MVQCVVIMYRRVVACTAVRRKSCVEHRTLPCPRNGQRIDCADRRSVIGCTPTNLKSVIHSRHHHHHRHHHPLKKHSLKKETIQVMNYTVFQKK